MGHRVLDVTYTPPAATEARTIPVDVWYPTLDAEGERATNTINAGEIFEKASTAPPLEPAGYPVHVYSHGSQGFGGTAGHMARTFASHGWVYVAPNHVGNLLSDPGGKKRVAIHFLRSTDVTAALDALEKLAGSDPLAGKLRTKRVLLSGHSFGAYTAWASAGVTMDTAVLRAKCDAGEFAAPCTADEIAVFGRGLGDARVAAFVPMAGGLVDFVGDYDAAKKPTLLMSGSLDVSPSAIFERTAGLDVTWLEFEGGCHELFALGGCSAFDKQLGWKLTSAWALAWGRRYVLGDAGEATTRLVTNAAPLSERIAWKHKGTLTPPAGP